jgi:inner membrane transporter RhtA
MLAGQFQPGPVVDAVTAGLLSSVVPFALDLTALRTVPARFFGVFMSVHPVLAVVAGALLLDQVPALHEVLGMAIVVASNIIAIGTLQRRQ